MISSKKGCIKGLIPFYKSRLNNYGWIGVEGDDSYWLSVSLEFADVEK